MSVTERLIRYCKIHTQSDPNQEEQTPSSARQFDLANLLVQELKQIGIDDAAVDEHCYVYGHLADNTDGNAKTVGFIAHMDTAPDFSGENVQPRIIENFDGNDIVLNSTRTMKMDDFPWMREFKGKRLLVAGGDTLLGADDKAGIAAIMAALEYLYEHPEVPHGPIAVAFTPDEEIGNGTKCFSLEKFRADFAYTMDGDAVSGIADETFNAASARVAFTGFSIHPGEAKDKMINAGSLACRFHAALPAYMTPEHTAGREGFIHLTHMSGATEKAELEYILRDHDSRKLEEKKQLMIKVVDYMNNLIGRNCVEISFRNSYRNMKSVLEEHPEAVSIADQALKNLGITPVNVPIRGGTDGANLSFMGLPCPNLGCGGGNFHGPYEYCVLDELEQSVQVILEIIRLTKEA